jgi:hypothetical protein
MHSAVTSRQPRFGFQKQLRPEQVSLNSATPNPSLKRSANGMPPGLGHGCTHIFHGPGLASYRWHSA